MQLGATPLGRPTDALAAIAQGDAVVFFLKSSKAVMLVVSCLLSAGCDSGQSNTFTFIGDLPPNFTYSALVDYEPEAGEPCFVTDWFRTMPELNRHWRKEYKPEAKIEIRKMIKGCHMVVRRIAMKINSTYGASLGDFGSDFARVAILETLDERYKKYFDAAGESVFYGECQWLFRTSGTTRILRKIMDCKKQNEKGEIGKGQPFAAYTLDQLPGKTVRMKIGLAPLERPYMKDTWVEFPNGWKRCLGEGFSDPRAYCRGNHTDFSSFFMVDGRECTIYPGCKE